MVDIEKALGTEVLNARVDEAKRVAAELDELLERVRAGQSRTKAIRELLPGQPVQSVMRRLRVYEVQGVEGLISRRFAPAKPLKMTPEVKGALQALAVTAPEAGSVVLSERLSTAMGIVVKPSTVQAALRELGLARPRGPRPKKPRSAEVVEPLGLAGAELLKAVDLDIGAVAALTQAIGDHLSTLPAPEGPVEDDRANRNERGQFLPGYNAPGERREPELGSRFNSVEVVRGAKDLAAMRVVSESFDTRYRKNLALMLLPVVVRGTRWSALEHWRGDYLGELVGIAYQASSLDKYLRELKYAGAADVARESVAEVWLAREGRVTDPVTGAAVVYGDIATKPLWTHHWTRSAKVSKTGRVQPAISVLTLHSGAGTPLVFRTFSGSVSLPAEIESTLSLYERHAGEQTARRLVVLDREGHALWLFDLLESKKWGFVIPLRASVVGPKAKFEDQGPWQPYGEAGDEVCEAMLWLNDHRRGQKPRRMRVLGRRRHRTDKVAWFATNRASDELSAADGIRLYFDRWPAQEHVYRAANGVVGFDAHHGYGKRKVDNVAVMDRQDRLTAQVGRLQAEILVNEQRRAEWEEERTLLLEALKHSQPRIAQMHDELGEAIEAGEAHDRLQLRLRSLKAMDAWLDQTRQKVEKLGHQVRAVEPKIEKARQAIVEKNAEIERWAARRQIFTVDVELDEIMTAFKLTFVNLARALMDDHLGVRLELETLIEAVLSLPGERCITKTSETIRIYRQERDPRLMAAVERACGSLTARTLRRDERSLRFELVPHPRAATRTDPKDP